jgi:putative two-component system response regulator
LKSTILIVDDIADNAALLAEGLRTGGYNDIHVVTDPTKVIDSCLELRPDLMLLDLRMPKVDGFEILTRLREVEDPPLVLVLTADVSVEARNKALGMGAKDFLSKPYGQEELMLRAANLLETRALHAGLRAANRDLETTINERTRDLWSAVQEVGATSAELRRSREQTVIRLALAAELKDDETSNHVTRVSRLRQGVRRTAPPRQRDA